VFAGIEEQDAADDAAQGAGRGQPAQPALMAAQIPELGDGAPQVAGAQGHRVGDIGGDRRNAQGHEGREGDEGAAAGQGIHRPPGHRRHSHEHKFKAAH
jgi:hypothetical protein